MLCTEIVSDIQNNFCTQHVLPMFCKKKSFWQRFTCTDEEKKELAVKIEASCRRFNNNHGSLSIDEFYNVIKLQNGVEVSKDELRRLSADLDMDKNFKISIKVSYIIHFWRMRDILHEILWMNVCAMYSLLKLNHSF